MQTSARGRRSFWRGLRRALVVAAAGAVPGSGSAQTVSGTVIDPTTTGPVAEAAVRLLDAGGDPRSEIATDTLGRFAFEVEAGQPFYLEVSRLGYLSTRSMLLEVGEGSTPPLTIELEPEPVALRGLEVEVEREAEEFLALLGHTPESLGERWISHEEIMAMPLSVGPFMVIDRRNTPGIRMDHRSPGELCVLMRGRSRPGACALVILNGLPINRVDAQAVRPSDLAGIALLPPVDATTFYGTRAVNGVVVMWTRRGG